MFGWISAYGITDMENLLWSYMHIFDCANGQCP